MRCAWIDTPSTSAPRLPGAGSRCGICRARGSAARDQRAGDGERGAGRGVDLGVVVRLHDLCHLEEAAEGPGDLHQQHRADGEVGGDENANTLLLRQGVNGLQFGVRDARCAGDPVNAALDRRSQGGGGHVGNGKVHHHVGSAGLDGRSYICIKGKVSGKLRGGSQVDSTHRDHVGSGTHCRKRLAAHAAGDAMYEHSELTAA